MSVFEQHQCVQSDPIEVAGRNADLTLFSRVSDYRPTQLSTLLYKERKLFEYFCKMHSIMPIELYPIFKHKMNEFSKHKRVVAFFKKYRKESKRVLNALERGPVTSRDLVGMGTMKSGWGAQRQPIEHNPQSPLDLWSSGNIPQGGRNKILRVNRERNTWKDPTKGPA